MNRSAVMIGTDLDSSPMKAMAYTFAAVLLAVPIIRFFRKRT